MTPEQIKALYSIVKNKALPDSKILERAKIIETLERETKMNFADTSDLHSKMDAFFAHALKIGGSLLRDYRESRGWSPELAAMVLEVSRRHLDRMEHNECPLSRRAYRLISGTETEIEQRRRLSIAGRFPQKTPSAGN